MSALELTVLSLRYSSWSMRPWLVLEHAGADFTWKTVELPHMQAQRGAADGGVGEAEPTTLSQRRALGSVHGLFPVLRVDGVPIHESLAICEFVAERYPDANLWPDNSMQRARARAISCEMVSGFAHMRGELGCHLFARVPDFTPGPGTATDVARIHEMWEECLDRSGGPFLFGDFCIADAMYYPVLSRFRTYGIPIPQPLVAYAGALDGLPAVARLLAVAAAEPNVPVYDEYVRALGGDPGAALPARE